jgi:hypothetical protein
MQRLGNSRREGRRRVVVGPTGRPMLAPRHARVDSERPETKNPAPRDGAHRLDTGSSVAASDHPAPDGNRLRPPDLRRQDIIYAG